MGSVSDDHRVGSVVAHMGKQMQMSWTGWEDSGGCHDACLLYIQIFPHPGVQTRQNLVLLN